MAPTGVGTQMDPKDPSYWQVKSPSDIEGYAHTKAVQSITPPAVNVGLAKQLPNNRGSQPLTDTDNPPLQPMPGGARMGINNAPVRTPMDTSNPAPAQIIPSPLQTASTGTKQLKHTDHDYWKIVTPSSVSKVQ